MLLDLDETLFHQGAATFDSALISDHRFYDRSTWTTFSPDGSVGLLSGMAVYKNLNLAEGFASIQARGKQHNLRLSRPLRPMKGGMSLEVGPLRTEWLEPHRKTRFVCEPGAEGDGFDITFRPSVAPYLEAHHYGKSDGRVHTDYWRFDNVGWTNGHIVVGGVEHRIDNWFGWRDHSWGVRPGVGGFEPYTGTRSDGGLPSSIMSGGLGMVLLYLGFATPGYGGFFQLKEDENGKRFYMHGSVGAVDQAPVEVVDVQYELKMVPGTRLFSHARLLLTSADGKQWDFEVESVGRSWAYKGTGYDRGYNDEKGQGIWRGNDLTVERDIYDISDVEEVVLPDGRHLRPRHREQPVRVKVNGEAGFGHFPFVIIGRNARLGVAA
ncbi:hypothetical protein [Paraburkholderia silvatlantica]|uniref:hypothetical protein n=1 Tax=Paraburkholderia silvatlantica TaxID=321895 RepID=UPI00375002E9